MKPYMLKIKRQLKEYKLFPLLTVCFLILTYALLVFNGVLALLINLPLILVLFVIFIMIGIIFPLKKSRYRFSRYLVSPLVYLFTTVLVTLFCFSFNNSPTIFATQVIHGYSVICISFRENNTYRIDYSDIIGGDKIVFGKYKKNDTLILLDKSFIMGRFMVNDSIKIEEGKYLKNIFLSKEGKETYRRLNMYKDCESASIGG